MGAHGFYGIMSCALISYWRACKIVLSVYIPLGSEGWKPFSMYVFVQIDFLQRPKRSRAAGWILLVVF